MGYYVTYRGIIEIPDAVDEQEVLQQLKDLNHKHELKTGGRWPKSGDPYEDSWFSWLPPKYHEDERLDSIDKILDMLGFGVDEGGRGEFGRVLRLDYDSKIGSEVHFLKVLADAGCFVDLEAEGEDGAKWHYFSADNELMEQEAQVSWGQPFPAGMYGMAHTDITNMVAKAMVGELNE